MGCTVRLLCMQERGGDAVNTYTALSALQFSSSPHWLYTVPVVLQMKKHKEYPRMVELLQEGEYAAQDCWDASDNARVGYCGARTGGGG